MDYPVYLGGNPVGKVQILQEGLYRRVICRCRMTGEVVCRLVALEGDRRIPIGIPVPAGDGFHLSKRIPARQLDLEDPEFQLIPSCGEKPGERFLPIIPEEPFSCIEGLQNAYLARKDGQLGILLRE